MSYSNKYNIKDYVTLFISEADNTPSNVGSGGTNPGGVYTWKIPQSFFSNQRSNVCTVGIMTGSISGVYTSHGVVVDYRSGLNSYSKKQRHIIGHGHSIGFKENEYFFENTDIELLVNARPDSISLGFYSEADNGAKVVAAGSITLAFCYYNASETNANLHNQFTPTLN